MMAIPKTNRVVVPGENYKCLSPIVRLSRVMGIAPYNFRKHNNDFTFELSWKWVIYSVIFNLLIVVTSAIGLTDYYKGKEVYEARMKEYLDKTVTYTDILVVLSPGFLTCIYTPLNIKQLKNFLTSLEQIDRLIAVKSNECKKSLTLTIVSMTVGTLILLVDMTLWVNIAKSSKSVFVIVLDLLPFYFAYLFTLVIELNYWHLVHLVEVRLRALNENLRGIRVYTNIGSDLILKKSQLGEILLQNVLRETPNKTTALNRKNITNLMKVYETIYEATMAVNSFYGFMILIVLIGCLIHLLVTPYCLYLQIKNTHQPYFIASQLFWMVCHVLRLILIVEPCHKCKMEVTKTSALVCKLLLASQYNEEVKPQLEMFGTLLAHCKIEYTANGLTVIDRQLLTNITGAVTTYLVILFQFNAA